MRIKVIIGLMLAAFVTGMFFVAAPAMAQQKQAPIKLGAILPLSDATGKDGARSMQLAVKEINKAGGILGRQVELIIVDDEMKPDKGAAALDKLATVDNVDVFIGGMSSGVTMALIPGMKKYEKVTVWCGGASGKIEQALEGQDWFFHLHTWDYQQGAFYEKGWVEMIQKYPQIKRKKTFLAYEEGPFGSNSYKASKPIADAAGLDLQGEAFKSAALGGGDYRSVLRHAKEYNPDMFVWGGYDKDALPMLEQAKEIGFAPALYVGAPPAWPVDFAQSPLNEGVVFYSMWNESIKSISKKSKAYSDAFNKEYKDSPTTYFGPLAYTNVMIVAEAIKRAGSLDKAALIKALEATKYDSPMGDKFVFGKSNVINHQAYATPKFMQWQKGKVVVLWPWEVATGKIMYPFPSWDKRGGKAAAAAAAAPAAKKAAPAAAKKDKK
jgi:branched-chain amino acid transport system substrate-binding protein